MNKEIKKPVIQALGLSLDYYRQTMPGYIPRLEEQFQRFLAEIKPQADICGANFCCSQQEVEDAVKQAERNSTDALLLIPLSYTASLMTFRPIMQTSLPVIIWNTQEACRITQDYSFDDLLMNHVAQGTQDLTNVLTRSGRTFGMESGHYRDKAALAKLAEWLNAAKAMQFAKRMRVGNDLRLDFVVQKKVMVELKAVAQLEAIHEAQLLTYIKLTKCRVGLLINFNVPTLKQGIKRMVL